MKNTVKNMMIKKIQEDLKKEADSSKIAVYSNFFKTNKGSYGEGDIFIGVSVPETRKIAKKYIDADLKIVEKLLESRIHEERLLAVLILVEKFKSNENKEVVKFYIKNNKKINNWDLVDLSADKILGKYYFDKDKSHLYKLAKSNNLWQRRISIISTFYFIKNNQFKDTLKISEILLNDKHDLIHKAVGWMLREVGKRNQKVLDEFLGKNYKNMPRTMLRYAIEKFPEDKRVKFLK